MENQDYNILGILKDTKKLGSMDLDAFVLSPDLNKENFKMAFISGGQGGGKIASEFCRLGYPLIAYNTSQEDLRDLEKTINNVPKEIRGKFKSIHLAGEGGASKDMDMGYQAVVDNIDVIESELAGEKCLEEADFVWIVISAGGGTGAGSLSLVSRIVAMMREERRVVRGGAMRQTFGLIVAIPDERTCKLKVAVNVAKLIAEIEQLHSEMQLGSVLLIDNGKIVDDFNKNYEGRVTYKTWAIDGNTKVARMVTELALLTGMPSSEVLDKSELLDIWSMPGYLNLAKKELGEGWVDEYLPEVEGESTAKLDSLPREDKKKVFGSLVKDAFKDNEFVSDIDFEAAIHGGMVVMTDGDVISTRDSKELSDAMELEVLNGAAVENSHFGFIKNTKHKGTVRGGEREKGKNDKNEMDGRIYAQCVSFTPPQYMMDWLSAAQEKQKKSEAKLAELAKKRSSISSLVSQLNTNSQIKKGEGVDIQSSISNLLNSNRGVKLNESSSTKLNIRDLVKNSDKGISTEKPAGNRRDELAKRFREQLEKKN